MAINCHNPIILYQLWAYSGFILYYCSVQLQNCYNIFLAPILSAYSGIRAAVIGSHWLCLQPTLSAFPTPLLLLPRITTPSICICIWFVYLFVFNVFFVQTKFCCPTFLNFCLRKKNLSQFWSGKGNFCWRSPNSPPRVSRYTSAWSVWCGTKYQQKAKSVLLQNINKKRHHKYTN